MDDIELTLVRVGTSSKGTFGVLRHGNIPFVLTMELPWQDNQSNVSCIPPGRYQCVRVLSPQFGDTFEVLNVPGREHILFHKGNYLRNTKGCILVGEKFEGPPSSPYIVDSGHAFEEFKMLLAGHKEFWLTIIEAL
ncbi:MAG: DUF5675 family protein [Anaerolineae bacterium]|nr:DUF5675 family protein [Anaerolineae bacterium]